MENVKICCPKCEWEPDGKPYWQCSCGHQWDTFSTGGCCPACRKVWEDTQCIACIKWSPHLDWYNGLEDIVKQLLEEIKKQWATEPVFSNTHHKVLLSKGRCEEDRKSLKARGRLKRTASL